MRTWHCAAARALREGEGEGEGERAREREGERDKHRYTHRNLALRCCTRFSRVRSSESILQKRDSLSMNR